MATNAQQLSPLFGRPQWTYVNVVAGPVRGPQPRLAIGSGRTGSPSQPGMGAALPSYVSEPDYEPSPFSYQPPNNAEFMHPLPRSIFTGEDGREMVGTWKPHDFTPAMRWMTIARSTYNWQVQTFAPRFRNLLLWQQAMRYRVNNVVQQARPLPQSNYFLGYKIDPAIAAAIGQSTMGGLG